MKKPFKKNIPDIEIEVAHGGSGKRQLLLSPADMISTNIDGATKGYLAGGGMFDWHNHDGTDEFFIVLQGTGQVEFEDGTLIIYGPGDLVYMPAPMKHKIINTGTDENQFYFFRIKNA